MANDFNNSAELHEHRLKSHRMVAEIAIVADATPADKVHSSDVAGVIILRTEGKTAEADAIEDLSGSFSAAADNAAGNSTFGVLVDLGDVAKVKKVTVSEQTALATSLASSIVASSAGNIAIEIVGTGLVLDSESPTLLLEIEYDTKA